MVTHCSTNWTWHMEGENDDDNDVNGDDNDNDDFDDSWLDVWLHGKVECDHCDDADALHLQSRCCHIRADFQHWRNDDWLMWCIVCCVWSSTSSLQLTRKIFCRIWVGRRRQAALITCQTVNTGYRSCNQMYILECYVVLTRMILMIYQYIILPRIYQPVWGDAD